MKVLIDYLQLGTNGIVLTVLGWLYLAYVKNIKAEIKLKDEQIKVSEKNLVFWKDKATELEKKSPEFFEGVLANRIKLREQELLRLNEDTIKNKSEIEEKNRQLDKLNSELEKAKYFSRALTYYDLDIDDEVIIPESEVELIDLGEVFVDSGSLMITIRAILIRNGKILNTLEKVHISTPNLEIYLNSGMILIDLMKFCHHTTKI